VFIKLYPYHLLHNPFPSSPTPSIDDSKILGGKRHNDAKNSIISCVEDIYNIDRINNDNNKFRIVTIVQDVGSGKTHLTLHVKISDLREKAIFSYLDLSQIYPKNIPSIYQSMIHGFDNDYLGMLRKEILFYILDKSKSNNKLAKKIFRLGFFESLSGKGLESKVLQIIANKTDLNIDKIDSLFEDEFSSSDLVIIKKIIQNKFDSYDSVTLLDMINRLSLLSRLNLKLLNKISIFQFDEFDATSDTLSFVKALINTHLPYTILMLISTPFAYNGIGMKDSSVFDRLEKANYKIDLAGSNSFEEISDIVLEYIRYYNQYSSLSETDIKDLLSKLKILYDDFDFRNIRSILNIMYNSFEIARHKNLQLVTEDSIDEALKSTYPGLKIKGSIMNISISEFIKIKNHMISVVDLKQEIITSIKTLLESIKQIDPHYENYYFSQNGIEIFDNDPNETSAISISGNSGALLFKQNLSLNNIAEFTSDGSSVFSGSNITGSETHKIILDRTKIIDLLYYAYKLKANMSTNEDTQRAILLAKSINLN